jgi:hypothetical protein
MSIKENLTAKIKIKKLFHSLVSTIKEPPGKWWLDKVLARELLDMSDFEHEKVRHLNLYVRPLEGRIMEVAVLDNELPIYHTTVADAALHKSPHWKEMFSIRNVRRIMNDQDVIASKGKESLKRIRDVALGMLDLTYTGDDLTLLLKDARRAVEQNSVARIQESLDLFFEMLDFQPLSLDVADTGLRTFARPKSSSGLVPAFEHLILFDEENLGLSLKKGTFSPQNDSDLARVLQYARGEERADLQGMGVFEFLAELALETDFLQGPASHRTTERTPEPSSSSCDRQATRKNAP